MMTDESTALWQEKVRPLLDALHRHVSIDQLEKLRDEARLEKEAPPAVLNIIDTVYRLRLEIERL